MNRPLSPAQSHRMKLAIAAAALLGAGPAWADLHQFAGDRLVLTTESGVVTVDTDSHASGRVTIDTEDESCGSSTVSGGSVILDTAGCDGTVHITVPARFPVTLTSAGDAKIRLGQDLGAVIATVAGDGPLFVKRAQSLVLGIRGGADATVDEVDGDARVDISGSGDARLKRINGSLTFGIRGSGDIIASEVHAPTATITNEGSGDVLLGQGDIRMLTVHLNGTGDLAVAATVHDAELQAAGGGDIRLSKTTGVVNRDAEGGSTITLADNGVEAFVLSKVAGVVTDAGEDDANNKMVVNLRGHQHGADDSDDSRRSGSHHFFAGIIVLGIAWMVFNTMRKNGALARLQSRFAAPGTPMPPSHPGVIAVRDAMARLEQRLGRVEGYVTSREFDLQQKFRDLDKKS